MREMEKSLMKGNCYESYYFVSRSSVVGLPSSLELGLVDLTGTVSVGSIEVWLGLVQPALALLLGDFVLLADGVGEGLDLTPADGARLIFVEVLEHPGPDLIRGLLALDLGHDEILGAVGTPGGIELSLGDVTGTVSVDSFEDWLGFMLQPGVAITFGDTVVFAGLVDVAFDLTPADGARVIGVDLLEHFGPDFIGVSLGRELAGDEGLDVLLGLVESESCGGSSESNESHSFKNNYNCSGAGSYIRPENVISHGIQ